MNATLAWAFFVAASLLVISGAKWLDDRERRRSFRGKRGAYSSAARPARAHGLLESGQIPLEGPRSSFPPESSNPVVPARDGDGAD